MRENREKKEEGMRLGLGQEGGCNEGHGWARPGKKTLGQACKFECWVASFLVLFSSFRAIFSWSNLWEVYSFFSHFPNPYKINKNILKF